MGADHPQPDGSRRHVLVLFPECPWYPHLVETVHYSFANRAIRY